MSEKSEYADAQEPRFDIPYAKQQIDESDITAVVDALRSDYVTQGPRLGWFEDGLKEATGARYAVAVSSGTAALHLSCLGLGLGKGDCGIVPAITFAATANCLRYVGAEVAFADVDPKTGLAGSAQFAEAIQRLSAKGKLKALLPVSFAGSVPDLQAIARLANSQQAYVIEDAAHSIGASYQLADGSLASSGSCQHSDAAILSFHPVKHVCAGEGGAILTNDDTLAKRIRRLRSHGVEKQDGWLYDQLELGYNYRMTELQAALGYSQLGKLNAFVSRRADLAARYIEAFDCEPFASRIEIATTDSRSSWHLFAIRFKNAVERRAAYDFLHSRGIRVQVHYIPLYRHTCYKEEKTEWLDGAEAFYATCLSLPLYPSLRDEEQDCVIDSLKAFLQA